MQIVRVDLHDLRTALDEAYTAAARTPPTYTAPTRATGQTPIRAVHIAELPSEALALH